MKCVYHFKTSEEKVRMCPKRNEFFIRRDVFSFTNYNKLIDIIVDEMYSLVTGSEYEDDRSAIG